MHLRIDSNCAKHLAEYHLLSCNSKEGVDNYTYSKLNDKALIFCSVCGAPLAIFDYTTCNIDTDDCYTLSINDIKYIYE